MNVGESGVQFVFSTGFDMTGETAIGINFTRPDGTALDIASPNANLTVGSIDVETVFGLFPAGKYLRYIFQPGDVNQVGIWSVRCTYTDAYQHLISDIATFEIYP